MSRLLVLLVPLLTFGCDSGTSSSSNLPPSIEAIEVSDEVLTFRPGGLHPTLSIRVVASDPDRDPLTTTITASGGTFERTGSRSITLSTPAELPIWASDLSAFSYTFEVTVSDGRAQASRSVTAEVRPSVGGLWIGGAEMSPASNRYLGFCMQVAGTEATVFYAYRVHDRGTGGQSGTAGSTGITSSFSIPVLSVGLMEPSEPEHPRHITSQISHDGTALSTTLTLVNGETRMLSMERTDECSSAAVQDWIDAL